MHPALLLVLAVAVDLALGDPRWLPHPVRWLGAWVSLVERAAWRPSFLAGIAAWLAVVLPAAVLAGGLAWVLAGIHPLASALSAAVAVWLAVCARDLADHAERVRRPLAAGDLAAARSAVGMIVGRDTDGLDQAEVARAAVEAVAESTVDGVIAPLCWAAAGALAGGHAAGAPGACAGLASGAWLFRAANTLDSRWGHRDARYRCFGWCAARADDLLALLPARLAALLITLAAPLAGGSPLVALRIWWRDAKLHASPNAGRPEAAMAGALGIRLGGCNRYDGEAHQGPLFNAPGRAPAATDIARAVRLMLAATLLASALLAALLLVV
ncbi:MAG: adenosylcobinamide-phosphate synthase CbiB [Planctomycetes bacterium]|nr:adenosylcobinamide-phosphate synthase CbiB [Planctomycetota bacterium]